MPHAYHPDFTTGDVELSSASGGLRFRCQMSILTRASTVFALMFADAKPDPEAASGEPSQILLDDDEATLEVLLRIAHGVPFLSVLDLEGDIDAVERVALAAEKYELRAALDVVRLALLSLTLRRPEHALRRYALASLLGWPHIAQDAATASLDVALAYREPLPLMDLRDLERLLALRHSRIAAFTEALNSAGGPFAFENSKMCSNRKHGMNEAKWRILKQAMLLEMWQRPSGASVLADSAATAAFRGMVCNPCGGSPVYDWESFCARLKALIDGLPDELP